MTASKLQEAITLIKSGDRQTGQRLLTEVLNAEPRNETAWLWMSALMSGEKRRFCLEKVLSLNPHHPQAREQLAKLGGIVSSPAQVVLTGVATPPPEPVSAPEISPIASGVSVPQEPQVWLTRAGKLLSSIIYLSEEDLYAFDIFESREGECFQILDEIRQGVGPREADHKMIVHHVLVKDIVSVALSNETLEITSVDEAGKETQTAAGINQENFDKLLVVLQKRLGPHFRKITRPMRNSTIGVLTLVPSLLTLCGTAFCYFFVLGLKAEVDAGAEAAGRVGVWVTLLLLIGPYGFLFIGGALLAILLVRMILLLAAPSQETVLTRLPK
jgi:hypothetical protein